jgi:endonuclease-3
LQSSTAEQNDDQDIAPETVPSFKKLKTLQIETPTKAQNDQDIAPEMVPEVVPSFKKLKTLQIETPTKAQNDEDIAVAKVKASQAITTTTSTKSPRTTTTTTTTTTTPNKSKIVTPSPNPKKKPPRKSPTPQTKTKTKTKTKTTLAPGDLEPPPGWESIYSLMEELRQDRSAPVDTDGSEALPQCHLGDKTRRFQVLIALMLSSQTKDAIVGETMRGLQTHGLTVDNLAQTSPTKLNELIYKVGFHNNKTKYIQKVVAILQTQYDGDIPPTAVAMMELPGIGPKMAFIIETVAWGNVTGIGIDTHMHRMLNELKWVHSKNPEQTRLQLEAWLPREKWGTINYLWVGFGQEVQQFKPKLLRKVLDCSRPVEALALVKCLGLDYNQIGAKLGITQEIHNILVNKEDVEGTKGGN